ncbi:MAG: tRNA-uridine aminocarboxypropyltransferase [Pseudohongiella sp.]|nr:tRNA-uridine aminocarboxypropyltransferase [Pseudohongiella sp.]
MSRQTCSRCLRPLSVCYCSKLTLQHNRWPVQIIQDRQESRHALGTARIAALSLSNCRLIHVDPDKQHADSMAELQVLQASQPVLIYPGEHADDITHLSSHSPCPLIFIDASWRRSRKLLHTLPWLGELPRYALQPSVPSRYRIRRQPGVNTLSTLEAIVFTLETLEFAPGKLDSMLATMDWVVDQQIRYMGHDVYQSNYQDKEYK